jgi:hypothetical protein
VPAFFRNIGFETTTILELFGRADVPDVEWIKIAGERGLVVVHKDARIPLPTGGTPGGSRSGPADGLFNQWKPESGGNGGSLPRQSKVN